MTLTDDVDFCYKADNLYDHPSDRSIRFDDPAIGVDWGVTDPILSDKDKTPPCWRTATATSFTERENEPMTIIVTGGAGFIGSNFVFHMLKGAPGLPDRVPGQADLCRQSVHPGPCDGQPQLPLCEGGYLRPGGRLQAV